MSGQDDRIRQGPRGGILRVAKGKKPAERLDGAATNRIENFIGATLRSLADWHPCVGAKGSVKMETLHFGVYDRMESIRDAMNALNDLSAYYKISDEIDGPIKTYAMVFIGTPISSEEDFERRYWKLVQILHDLDGLEQGYDPKVSMHPTDQNFELSLAGRAVFTTTLHPQNSRPARRAPYPVFICNQISQFNDLRRSGDFPKWQNAIRNADADLDPTGKPNPLLVDHGQGSAASQLAGSNHSPTPFLPRQSREEKLDGLINIIEAVCHENLPSAVIAQVLAKAKSLREPCPDLFGQDGD